MLVTKGEPTPGEWRARNDRHGPYVVSDDGINICEMSESSRAAGPDDDAERIANARLIAAAPDMLEALREAHDELDCALMDEPYVATEKTWAILDRTKAAIAKAKGRTDES